MYGEWGFRANALNVAPRRLERRIGGIPRAELDHNFRDRRWRRIANRPRAPGTEIRVIWFAMARSGSFSLNALDHRSSRTLEFRPPMTGPRKLLLLVALLLSEELHATASEPADDAAWPDVLQGDDIHRVVTVQTSDPAIPAAVVIPDESRLDDADGDALARHVDLEEVRWTADASESIVSLATRWGVRVETLVELNPELAGREGVQAGDRFVIHRDDPAHPTLSLGAPNRGRLANGLPLPEGDHWEFRSRRRRSYGARNTVTALVEAMETYGAHFPTAEPIRMGELSARTGGRAAPHKSHRTGRDVDIGYVLRDPPAEGWRHASPRDFDVEHNWAFVRALVATGEVQQIYMSSGLIKLLQARAAKELSSEELAVFFWDDHAGPQQRPVLKHQNGHRDHMHVRFRCESDNPNCRERSVEKKKRRKGGKKKA
jgi:hypothetical protein